MAVRYDHEHCCFFEISLPLGLLQVYEITAQPGFSLLATMNPGGDHGKREVG